MLSCKNVKIFPSLKRGLSAMKKRPPETSGPKQTATQGQGLSLPIKVCL